MYSCWNNLALLCCDDEIQTFWVWHGETFFLNCWTIFQPSLSQSGEALYRLTCCQSSHHAVKQMFSDKTRQTWTFTSWRLTKSVTFHLLDFLHHLIKSVLTHVFSIGQMPLTGRCAVVSSPAITHFCWLLQSKLENAKSISHQKKNHYEEYKTESEAQFEEHTDSTNRKVSYSRSNCSAVRETQI